MSLIDSILELKNRCTIAEEIGMENQLSLREISCIIEVGRGDRICSKELSTAINLSPSRGSRIITKLVDRGLLESALCLNDKRYIELTLSTAGRLCLESIEQKKVACEKEILEKLAKSEKETVEEGLTLLLRAL